MFLLLCSSDDRPALWAASRLRACGIEPLVVLTPELLHFSFGWEHRLHREGGASIAFRLADGRWIRGADIRGVVNRVAYLPAHLVERVVPGDRLYTLQEWTALHISWLSSLAAPVLNLPVMQGLCGAWRDRSEWAWLAGQAALETTPYVQHVGGSSPETQSGFATEMPHAPAVQRGPARTVIVVDGRAIAERLPDHVADACGRLAALAKTRILGVDLDVRTGCFISASPRPDLRCGGAAFIDVLASTLRAAA